MKLESEKRATPRATYEADGVFVEAMVAAAFGICPQSMREAGRGGARVALARQVAIYLSHTRLGFTYAAAGSVFGRDRTTAAHACRTIEDKREDIKLDEIVACLERAMDVWLFVTDIGQGRS